ncbi:MAG: efflux RND transporter periplasmic adaptor subunit [Acidobacteria bacterium]|nr:efflux RND transporter periplasmic adaptor subunit [Acidobacteriota bacterium]
MLNLRLRGVAGLAILVAATAIAGCSDEPVERVVDLVVPVTVQPVGTATMETAVQSTGTLRSTREAELRAEIRGQLFYDTLAAGRPAEGVAVTAGEQVARLESDEYVIGLRLDSRRQAVDNARRHVAEKEREHDEGLTVPSEVDAARKTLIDAETDLADAEVRLLKQRILAPIDGYLAELSEATESTMVEANDVIGKIVDYSGVIADLSIPNSDIASVERGQIVRVANSAFGDRLFEGRVVMIDPTLDPSTRTFHVEVQLENPELALRPGMFVKADIVTEVREGIVVVARELVLTRQNRDVVFVEVDGRAEMRPIEVGLEDDTVVEVLSGLEVGDRVITSNYETLRTRTPVRVTGRDGPGS